jgi:hypothetical protein
LDGLAKRHSKTSAGNGDKKNMSKDIDFSSPENFGSISFNGIPNVLDCSPLALKDMGVSPAVGAHTARVSSAQYKGPSIG